MTGDDLSSRTEVRIASDGLLLAASLRLPSASGGPVPVIVQAPGWMSSRDAAHYRPYQRALVDKGFAVLALDYRGIGESEGPRDKVDPAWYVRDLRSAVSWLCADERFDERRIGMLGSGAIGAGAAIVCAAGDPRVAALVALSAVADGEDWLRSMRSDAVWADLWGRVERNRRGLARGERDEPVDPTVDIVIPTPERAAIGFKSDLAGTAPLKLGLSTVEEIARFAPIAEVARRSPRAPMLIWSADDTVVPPRHARALLELCAEPRGALELHGTSSYSMHTARREEITEAIVSWFRTHLDDGVA